MVFLFCKPFQSLLLKNRFDPELELCPVGLDANRPKVPAECGGGNTSRVLMYEKTSTFRVNEDGCSFGRLLATRFKNNCFFFAGDIGERQFAYLPNATKIRKTVFRIDTDLTASRSYWLVRQHVRPRMIVG
jgi:hypothetical protein